MRPDWENVVTPVIDYIKAIPEYSERPLVLLGWSFGGYLALRAAVYESRLAAWVRADPGLLGAMSVFGRATGGASADQLQRKIDNDPGLHWRFVQRGFWVQGKATLSEFLTEMQRYDLGDSAKQIQCPTLLTMADNIHCRRRPATVRQPNLPEDAVAFRSRGRRRRPLRNGQSFAAQRRSFRLARRHDLNPEVTHG